MQTGEGAFSLKPVPPFRLDLTVWALRRRPDNLVDRWDGRTYRRILLHDGGPVEISVEQTAPPDRPTIRVDISGKVGGRSAEPAVRAVVERLLGVRTDLSGFYGFAETDPLLGPLAERFRGVKPPRFPTVFEALTNAIACQQLSLTVGIRLLNRLVAACGPAFHGTSGESHAFPRPADVASVSPEALRRAGWSRNKVQALMELAHGVLEKRIDLERLGYRDDAAVAAALLRLHGIGRWSAEDAMLRGLGRLHVFPGDDVGARNYLEKRIQAGKRLDYEGIRRTVADWHPFAGLAYFHFLLDGLAKAGILSETFPPSS